MQDSEPPADGQDSNVIRRRRASVPDNEMVELFQKLLVWIGEDQTREGLEKTPERALKAWRDWTSGYEEDPRKHLEVTFGETDGYHGLVYVGPIKVRSTCEHHLAPIMCKVHVGYIPNGHVVGLSKLPRMVLGYAMRLQNQERLTQQILDAIQEKVQPRGIAVAIEGKHGCMTTRGVKTHEARMFTMLTEGECKDPLHHAEFLNRIGSKKSSKPALDF